MTGRFFRLSGSNEVDLCRITKSQLGNEQFLSASLKKFILGWALYFPNLVWLTLCGRPQLGKMVKNSPRSKCFCVTINLGDEADDCLPHWVVLPDEFRYMVWQREAGDKTQREHLQMYIETKKCTAVTTLQKKYHGFWTLANGTAEQNKVYCTKLECRLDGPWELGEPIKKGQRTDINTALETVRKRGYEAAFMEHPQTVVRYANGFQKYGHIVAKRQRQDEGYVAPTIYVLWGPSGTGKTKWAMESNDSTWMIPDLEEKWFDGYNGEHRIVMDEFAHQWKLHTMLRFLDGNMLTPPTKGAHVVLRNREWVITTNLAPKDWYPKCNQTQRDALFNRLFHRFEGSVVFLPALGHAGIETACPCSVCTYPLDSFS